MLLISYRRPQHALGTISNSFVFSFIFFHHLLFPALLHILFSLSPPLSLSLSLSLSGLFVLKSWKWPVLRWDKRRTSETDCGVYLSFFLLFLNNILSTLKFIEGSATRVVHMTRMENWWWVEQNLLKLYVSAFSQTRVVWKWLKKFMYCL